MSTPKEIIEYCETAYDDPNDCFGKCFDSADNTCMKHCVLTNRCREYMKLPRFINLLDEADHEEL